MFDHSAIASFAFLSVRECRDTFAQVCTVLIRVVNDRDSLNDWQRQPKIL